MGTPKDAALAGEEQRGFALALLTAPLITACGDDQLTAGDDRTVPQLISPAEGEIMDNGCFVGLLLPGDNIVWDFDWTDVAGASAYHLYVIGPYATFPVIDDIVGLSSFHSESGGYIIERNSYGWMWKVRARIGSQWRPWSPVRTFDVEPSCRPDG